MVSGTGIGALQGQFGIRSLLTARCKVLRVSARRSRAPGSIKWFEGLAADHNHGGKDVARADDTQSGEI